jgi:hypothetical protein
MLICAGDEALCVGQVISRKRKAGDKSDITAAARVQQYTLICFMSGRQGAVLTAAVFILRRKAVAPRIQLKKLFS